MRLKVLALSLIALVGTACAQSVSLVPQTDSGALIYRNLSILATDVSIKAGKGQIYTAVLFNAAGSTRFFKFYNALIADVTVGTTPPVLTVPVGSGATVAVSVSTGIKFSTAISVACTTGVADADTGAPSANDCVANIFYK